MKRIVFIEPKSPDLHIFSGFPLPRLGPVILGTIAGELGWEVSVIFEERHPIDWAKIYRADLVAISTITSTAPRAYAIADKIRANGIPVIMGGPHVTFLPDEALEHCDFVLRGEGEIAFPIFLDEFAGNKKWRSVPNLSFAEEIIRDTGCKPGTGTRAEFNVQNEITHNCVQLDDLPIPDFSLIEGKAPLMAGKRIIPVQTSRGCPFDCSFCSVTGMFGRKYRWRSTDHIIKELHTHNKKRNYIFFYDDNFTASPKRTKELLKRMIKENFTFEWSTQVRADTAKDSEILELMKRAGCHTVFIGFESVNPESLRSIKKKATVDDMKTAARGFRKNGINVHGMFILGLDEDNPSAVKETVRFARRNWLSSAQFLILTPLPGTRCYDDLAKDGRLKFNDWSLYDAHHVVYQPNNFSLAALQKAQMFAHKRFYSFRETLRRLTRFKFLDIGIAHYARRLNSNWYKNNKAYVRLLDLLKTNKKLSITADIRQIINIDEPEKVKPGTINNKQLVEVN